MNADNSIRLALESVSDLPAAEALRVMRLAGQLLRAVQVARETGAALPDVAPADNAPVAEVLAELLAIEAGDFLQAAAVADSALRELLDSVEPHGPTQ